MIEVLIAILFVILIFSYFFTNRDYINPAILFISGFIICCVVASGYKKEWQLLLDETTTTLVTLSCIAFAIGQIGINHKRKIQNNITFTNISNKKLLLLIITQILITIYINVQRMKFTGLSFVDTIAQYNYESKFGDFDLKLAPGVGFIAGFCNMFGYFCAILIPLYHFNKTTDKKTIYLLWTNFLICSISSLFSGSRGELLNYIIALLYSYLFIHKLKGYSLFEAFSLKRVLVIIVSMYLFANSFAGLGSLLGRESSDDEYMTSDYIFAMYCGAEIVNLNNYIISTKKHKILTKKFGENTFANLHNSYNSENKKNRPDNYFESVNGYNLGNVKTCIYAPYADFGFNGALITMFLTSFLISYIYRKSKDPNIIKSGIPTIYLFLLVYLCGNIFQAFFSNKIIEALERLINYRQILILLLMYIYFYGINVRMNTIKKHFITKW